jgi:hypothetical protein
VNSTDANRRAVVETADVLKIGFQAVGRTEEKVLVANQEDTDREKQQPHNN